jgi:hypothetical protein
MSIQLVSIPDAAANYCPAWPLAFSQEYRSNYRGRWGGKNIQVGGIPEPLATLLSRYTFHPNIGTCSCPECTGLNNLIVQRSEIHSWASQAGLEAARQALQQISSLLGTIATNDEIGLAFLEVASPLSPRASLYWLCKWRRKLRKVIAAIEAEQDVSDKCLPPAGEPGAAADGGGMSPFPGS